jgi:hypothetical protein
MLIDLEDRAGVSRPADVGEELSEVGPRGT